MKTFIALMLTALLSACVTAPQNMQEGVAAAYLTVDTLAQSIGSAQLSGVITTAQEDELLDRLTKSLEYLGLARSAMDVQSQDAYLRMALVILTSVEGELK